MFFFYQSINYIVSFFILTLVLYKTNNIIRKTKFLNYKNVIIGFRVIEVLKNYDIRFN